MGLKLPLREPFGKTIVEDGRTFMLIGSDHQINILTIYVVIVRTYLSADEKFLLKRKHTRVLWFFNFPW
jgi:hypothetical protein